MNAGLLLEGGQDGREQGLEIGGGGEAEGLLGEEARSAEEQKGEGEAKPRRG